MADSWFQRLRAWLRPGPDGPEQQKTMLSTPNLDVLFHRQVALLELVSFRLAKVEHAVATLTEKVDAMTQEVLDLQNKVAAETTVIQSAITLLTNLSQLIRDNLDNKPALVQLAADIDASTQALANAVAANTPATP